MGSPFHMLALDMVGELLLPLQLFRAMGLIPLTLLMEGAAKGSEMQWFNFYHPNHNRNVLND